MYIKIIIIIELNIEKNENMDHLQVPIKDDIKRKENSQKCSDQKREEKTKKVKQQITSVSNDDELQATTSGTNEME